MTVSALPKASPCPGQTGLSLVELLISMTLGLVVLVAIGYLYTGSRQSYRQQDNLARLQENGRYAMELLSQEIRMAGFIGCPNLRKVAPAMRANNSQIPSLGYAGGSIRPAIGLRPEATAEEYQTVSGLSPDNTNSIRTTRLANTDLLIIHRAGSEMFPLRANMASPTSAIQISGSHTGLARNDNDILIISDCTQADIFCANEVTPNEPNGGDADINPTAGCNDPASLSKAYNTSAMVMALQSSVFFLRNNSAGNPSLYIKRWAADAPAAGDTDELVENVEGMRVRFGVDTDNNGTVDQYHKASDVADWAQVRAVRVSLLLRSPDDNVADQPQTYVFDSNDDGTPESILAGDRRIRQVFTTTVAIRNGTTD